LSWQQNDDVCQYYDRKFRKKVLSNLNDKIKEYLDETICPKSASQMVDCYRCESGPGECTEFMIFKDDDQLKRYNNYHTWMTPAMWSTWEESGAVPHEMGTVADYNALHREMKEPIYSNCVRVLPSHGTKLPNGCPTRVPYQYPGNNRCFERIWDGEMCNVNPQQDPLVWQQNDRKCHYDDVEKPTPGHFYAYSSRNDCSGDPIGSFNWADKLDVCEDITISSKSMGGSDIFPAGATKYFKMWCDADVLKSAVYSTVGCSGAPVREPSVIPRAASGDCHVRTNWEGGLVQSYVTTEPKGEWYYELGGAFKFADGQYPCPNRRTLLETASTMSRLLNSMH